MFFHPAAVGTLNQFEISQLIRAYFKQLLGRNLMVEMDEPVAISGQNRKDITFGLSQNRFFLQPKRDFFVFTDP